ncbi:nucleotidyltransferase domain-containing protein [Candidatus Woesearchaeota archaeon]|nr:nucleotidyltransferase domain-containing protein [Candidatus Woesearchaeota archaeon]
MVLGYDEPRPTEKQYKEFMNRFREGLESLNYNGLSLMVYGSYVRGDYVPGRSDIDAVIITPDNVVINKGILKQMSSVLHNSLIQTNIPFQVTLTDIVTMRDGRFNSYNSTFRDYFLEERTIVIGPDYIDQFKFEMPEHPEQDALRFNLRKSRQGLLFSEHYRNSDYKIFIEKFNKSLDAISRGSKQVIHMVDGRLRKNRFSAISLIQNIFPDLDVEILRRIKYLYENLEELDKLYRNSEETINMWGSAVTLFEELIRGYIKKHPRK